MGWHGCVDDGPRKRARRREPTSEEGVPLGKAQGRYRCGGGRKKAVRQSLSGMAQKKALKKYGVSIRMACHTFCNSESC